MVQHKLPLRGLFSIFVFFFFKFEFKEVSGSKDRKHRGKKRNSNTCENIHRLTKDGHTNNSDAAPYLVFSEGQQGRETLAAYRTHVVLGRATVRLGVLAEAVLGEERSGAHVTLVVPLDEVCLLLSGAWHARK